MRNPDSLDSIVLEIRDEGTHIPALAIKMQAVSPVQVYGIHDRAGFSPDGSTILLVRLEDVAASYDAFKWPEKRGRTMQAAHYWIRDHFDELLDGDVVDVQFILGETQVKKVSERFRR